LDAQVERLFFRGLALTLMKPTTALPGRLAISCPIALQASNYCIQGKYTVKKQF
jgi:hypothetical protein